MPIRPYYTSKTHGAVLTHTHAALYPGHLSHPHTLPLISVVTLPYLAVLGDPYPVPLYLSRGAKVRVQ